MIEKDPIEDLFRTEAIKNTSEAKPREIVWQKIERELNPKHEKPLKSFISNIWFSAAVFALIAIPYFYFLIENLNQEHYQKIVIKETKDYINTNPLVLHDSIISKKRYVKDSILTETQIVVNNSDSHIKREKNSIINENINIDSALILEDSVFAVASLNFNDIDSLAIAYNSESKSRSLSKSIDAKIKPKEPIIYYPNRLILNDKVNHVSFYFVENLNNRLTFKKNEIEIYIYKEDDLIKVSANSQKIKKDLLDLVFRNKESIFNYYINLSAIKS